MSKFEASAYCLLTASSPLPHEPRPALGYTLPQHRGPKKESNGIVSLANTACPPTQTQDRWDKEPGKIERINKLRTYWANGGNHIMKANVSLRSPYTVEPPSASALFFL